MTGYEDLADLGQRRANRGYLEEHVDAVAIFREHALKAGHLPGDAFQSRISIAARSLIHCCERGAWCVPL
jgi:hypothetical protein